MMLRLFLWVMFILVGFLSGSIMFCRIIPMKFFGKDIEQEGSDGNPGAANVFIHCGVPVGILCLFLDMAKGFIPVYVAARCLGYEHFMFAFVMLAPVLGHAVAPFNQYHGGKCIATTFGVLLSMLFVSYAALILAVVYIVFSTVIKISPNRIRSIWAFSVFAAVAFPFLWYVGQISIGVGCLFIAITAIIKHTKYFDAFALNEKEGEEEFAVREEEVTEKN